MSSFRFFLRAESLHKNQKTEYFPPVLLCFLLFLLYSDRIFKRISRLGDISLSSSSSTRAWRVVFVFLSLHSSLPTSPSSLEKRREKMIRMILCCWGVCTLLDTGRSRRHRPPPLSEFVVSLRVLLQLLLFLLFSVLSSSVSSFSSSASPLLHRYYASFSFSPALSGERTGKFECCER